jgi:DNA-binding GntR family transcriptional regulator
MTRTKLHKQARHCIERLITDRALKPGSQLPNETNLASEFFVSRTTIRNALKVLEQEGKIERNARPMDDRPAAPVGIAIRFIG